MILFVVEPYKMPQEELTNDSSRTSSPNFQTSASGANCDLQSSYSSKQIEMNIVLPYLPESKVTQEFHTEEHIPRVSAGAGRVMRRREALLNLDGLARFQQAIEDNMGNNFEAQTEQTEESRHEEYTQRSRELLTRLRGEMAQTSTERDVGGTLSEPQIVASSNESRDVDL